MVEALSLALRNANIVTPFRIISQGSLVDGKRIAAIGKTDELAISVDTKDYDLDALTLAPGYIDPLYTDEVESGGADMSRCSRAQASRHFC